MACMRCEQISRLFEWAAGRVQAPGCRDRRARGRKRLTRARALPVPHCRVRTGSEGIDCLTPLRLRQVRVPLLHGGGVAAHMHTDCFGDH